MTGKPKVEYIYNKHFFEQLYKYMLENNVNTSLDATNTVWFILDVEEILIKEYGYRRTEVGGIQ